MAEHSIEIQDFILSRELAEVYLLLDHISAADGKKLPDLSGEPIFKDLDKPWLVQVCDITWPPEDTTREQDARNAAKLLVAKDALNEAASPATGTTIAFTLMMAGEARETDKEASWWRRPRFGFGGGDGDSGNGGGALGGGGAGGRPIIPTRASLAALADHGLARWALFYRSLLYFLFFFLFVWAMLTCFLSWDLATGTALLKRVDSFKQVTVTTPPATGAATPGTGTATPGPTPSPGASPTPPVTQATVSQTIVTSENDPKLRKTADENLAAWLDSRGFMRWLIKRLMGAGEEESTTLVEGAAPTAPTGTPGSPPAKPELVTTTNVQWATAFLGVLASNVLPIFYGLLGAGAAVVRVVSTKMRDSVLSPRDIILAYVQLGLGAMMGLCIGLFVNPGTSPGGTSQAGLIGSIPLSASALSFIAGFGVEQVFRALESLIRRIFDAEAPRTTVKT